MSGADGTGLDMAIARIPGCGKHSGESLCRQRILWVSALAPPAREARHCVLGQATEGSLASQSIAEQLIDDVPMVRSQRDRGLMVILSLGSLAVVVIPRERALQSSERRQE